MSAPIQIPRSRIPALSGTQWDTLATALQPGHRYFEQDLVRLGIEAVFTVAVLLVLAADEAATGYLAIYHCGEEPLGERAMLDGFPPMPWECPACGACVADLADLRFDFFCQLESAVVFVESANV